MLQHNKGVNDEYQPRKINELKAVFEYLKSNPATATMAATDLKIYRPNLCRRKRTLEKAGLLAEVKKAYCQVTKHKAAYLTTNPALFPIHLQLNLFEL